MGVITLRGIITQLMGIITQLKGVTTEVKGALMEEVMHFKSLLLLWSVVINIFWDYMLY